MGITKYDVSILETVIDECKPKHVLELGAQVMYDQVYGRTVFAKEWYEEKNIMYTAIDLAGDNGSLKFDLASPLDMFKEQFDLVTDVGSSEHVVQASKYETIQFDGGIHSVYPKEVDNIDLGYYNCWLNKFNFLKWGGCLYSANPKTGNWPRHGYTYLDLNFYFELEKKSNLKINFLQEHPASGNLENGWEIICIMYKTGNKFPSFEEFSKIKVYRS